MYYQGLLVKDRSKTWKETLDELAEVSKLLGYADEQTAIKDLASREFVSGYASIEEESKSTETPSALQHTVLGRIMSENFISYKTMCHIISMDSDASLRDLLEILAGATEFSNLRPRQGEFAALNKLGSHPDIRFGIDKVKTYADKVFLHLQVTFGNVTLDDDKGKTEISSSLQTQIAIYSAAPRIAKAIFKVAVEKKFGGAAVSALELLHTINGKAWEDSPAIFRELDHIGPKSIAVLAANGVTCEWKQGGLTQRGTISFNSTLGDWRFG